MFRKALLKIFIITIIITWTKGSFFGMFTSCCRREKQEVSSWRPSTARMDQHRHRGTDITEENKRRQFLQTKQKNETKLGHFFPSRPMCFLFISDSHNKAYSFTDGQAGPPKIVQEVLADLRLTHGIKQNNAYRMK